MKNNQNVVQCQKRTTSREQPKSASYLRLNNLQGKTQLIVKFFIHHTVKKSRKDALEIEKTNLPLGKIKIKKSIW